MLNPSEKAYCQALLALKAMDYQRAHELFSEAAPGLKDNQEFTLLSQTTALLVAVKRQLGTLSESAEGELTIEEVFSDG
ncbi:MAG: hypothetical protein ABIE70_08130 [bacterium]